MKYLNVYLFILLTSAICFSSEWQTIPGTGELIIIESGNSMFPHPARKKQHHQKRLAL